MRSVGIVAEYNPFHRGHEYQLRSALDAAGAQVAVVVMSGDFVQRGEPAIVDKYTRTRMALDGGANLVLELPFKYAVASAENFAFGAVGVLHFLGVDALCFGSEGGDVEALGKVAGLILEEPPEYKSILKKALSEGKTYPQGVAYACEMLLGDEGNVLARPNDLLGVEYIKALRRLGSGMEVYAVKRLGAGHNQKEAHENQVYSSATAIRGLALQGRMNEAASFMPQSSGEMLCDIASGGRLASIDDFSELLNYRIYSIMREDSSLLMNYADVGEPLANRLSAIYGGECFDGTVSCLIDRLKTRNVTRSRISRALLHILLDVYVDSYQSMSPYARVLGFDPKGREFLGAIRGKCQMPVITKAADGDGFLGHDIYASRIYNMVMKEKHGVAITDDYRMQPIIKNA